MQGININENENSIILSKEFFEKEPTMVVVTKFTQDYYVNMQPYDEYSFIVSLTAKNTENTESKQVMLGKFCNELIEQQVRHDLQKQFGKIRNTIVEHAFSPLKK